MNSVPFTPGSALTTAAEQDAQWFVFDGGRLLVSAAADAVEVPVIRSLEALGLGPLRTQFLGTLGPRPVFSAEVAPDASPPAGWMFEGLRRLLPRVDAEFFALASRAFQVKEWDRCHQFCGACGAQTVLKGGEHCRECPRCGEAYYPRLSPVVMILIQRGRELLLARSPRFPAGMYSALAGFVEPGETLEQAAAREVREEVGLEIARLRYFGSQSWPFPHSLMIAFLVEHAGGEIRLGDPEIEDAGWYLPERLPALPHALSIARRLIDSALAQSRPEGGGGDAS
ncbi:MAG TPA: NAD(+) diphosphatase [Burkholderiales bacterium]|nr:NAD(+) diphosphatase [Burkholderiales bacterium]